MPECDVTVSGGRVVLGDEVVEATACINGGRIAEIAPTDRGVGREVDASGCVVLPGRHRSARARGWPYQDYTSADTYGTASEAAIHGGTTSIPAGIRRGEGHALWVINEGRGF